MYTNQYYCLTDFKCQEMCNMALILKLCIPSMIPFTCCCVYLKYVEEGLGPNQKPILEASVNGTTRCEARCVFYLVMPTIQGEIQGYYEVIWRP